MQNNTLDGRPITAGASGFSIYSTERASTPETPVPVLTPTELLNQINNLKGFCNQVRLTAALRDLYEHINDTNNPHHTDMDAFTQEVADVLYQEYKKQGGTGSLEFYLNCLFQTLRIASLDEMGDPENENLLISIRGASDYIKQHETDPEAHADLFEKIFPGEAPTYDPTFSCFASVGVSEYFVRKITPGNNDTEDTSAASENRICSRVGSDLRLHFTNYSNYDPVDYSTGQAAIACFGARTNEIANSNDFTTLTPINVSVSTGDTILDPAEEQGEVCVVTTLRDAAPCKHTLYIPDVTIDLSIEKTFSVFAKRVNCRYLGITWKDMEKSDIEVRAIYDLLAGKCLIMNSLERYSANIVELADGWYRCEFTMYHRIGQEADLNLTFFKEKTADYDMQFQGDHEICGYLWGMQLEEGINASPYIPTTGIPRTREATGVVIPFDAEWWEPSASTIQIAYVNPGKYHQESVIRSIFTITDDNDSEVCTCRSRMDGSMELLRYSTESTNGAPVPVVIYQDIFPYDNRRWLQFVHGIDNEKILSLFNESHGLNLDTPETWDGGTKLYLGTDPHGNSLNGYIRSITIYPRRATEQEAKFMNGEEIHG